jgi:hypothetical protein
MELGSGYQIVNGIVQGVLISPHKDGGKVIVHSSRLAGMSGTTPFQTSIVFELQEGKMGQAIGYAVWPNLTYTLP